jgi:hypothetical protein
VRREHTVLVEQGEPPATLKHSLDYEHHVGPTGIELVEHQRHGPLERPRKDAFLELGDLHAVTYNDRVSADEVEPGDVTIEVHANTRPVQPSSDLLDVCGLAGAMAALKQHTPVVAKPSQDRRSNLRIEPVGRIALRDVLLRRGEAPDVKVRFEAEDSLNVDQNRGFKTQT